VLGCARRLTGEALHAIPCRSWPLRQHRQLRKSSTPKSRPSLPTTGCVWQRAQPVGHIRTVAGPLDLLPAALTRRRIHAFDHYTVSPAWPAVLAGSRRPADRLHLQVAGRLALGLQQLEVARAGRRHQVGCRSAGRPAITCCKLTEKRSAAAWCMWPLATFPIYSCHRSTASGFALSEQQHSRHPTLTHPSPATPSPPAASPLRQNCLGVWTARGDAGADGQWGDFYCWDLGPFLCADNGEMRR
jgi:hypothetical protein